MSGASISYLTVAIVADYSANDMFKAVDASDTALIALNFNSEMERSFDASDAELHYLLANLPDSGRMAIAYSNGILRGRDLALFLRCSMTFVGPKAIMSSGFECPGAAAVYAAAAARIGTVAAEKLLFGPTDVRCAAAINSSLALPAAKIEDAITLSQVRYATLSSVAKANLITWPFPLQAAMALIDEPMRI